MKIGFLFFALFASLLVNQTGWAKEIPPLPEHYILDESRAIDAQTYAELDRLTQEHERLTGEQIYIAVFKSIDGEDFAKYTETLFRSWKIGQFKKNNGVLISVFLNEKLARVEAGFGLEHLLSPDQAQDTVRQYLMPDLKVGNLGQGLILTLQSVLKSIGSPLATNSIPQIKEASKVGTNSAIYLVAIPLFLILGYLVDKILAAEAIFNRNGWKRTPLFNWPYLGKKRGGGANGSW